MRNFGSEQNWVPDMADRELVRDLVMLGCPDHRIATHFGVTKRRLLEVFAYELAVYSDQANTEVMKKLYARCMQGDIKAITFWMERRAGWTTQAAENNNVSNVKPVSQRNSLPIAVVVRDDNNEEQRVSLTEYAKRTLKSVS